MMDMKVVPCGISSRAIPAEGSASRPRVQTSRLASLSISSDLGSKRIVSSGGWREGYDGGANPLVPGFDVVIESDPVHGESTRMNCCRDALLMAIPEAPVRPGRRPVGFSVLHTAGGIDGGERVSEFADAVERRRGADSRPERASRSAGTAS